MNVHPKGPLRIRCKGIGCDIAVKRCGQLCLACQLDKGIVQKPMYEGLGRPSNRERQEMMEALLRDASD